MDSINPRIYWRGPLPAMPMPTAQELGRRIERATAALRRANGEHAEQLEQDIRVYRMQLERVLALTAGVAICASF